MLKFEEEVPALLRQKYNLIVWSDIPKLLNKIDKNTTDYEILKDIYNQYPKDDINLEESTVMDLQYRLSLLIMVKLKIIQLSKDIESDLIDLDSDLVNKLSEIEEAITAASRTDITIVKEYLIKNGIANTILGVVTLDPDSTITKVVMSISPENLVKRFKYELLRITKLLKNLMYQLTK